MIVRTTVARSAIALTGALVLAPFIGGCGGGETSASSNGGYIDASITRLKPLGWLGAQTQPLNRPLTVVLEGESQVPGGLVVRELLTDGALAAAGAQVGDVIVRIGQSWVPLNEDPTVDVVRLVEQAIGSGDVSIDVLCWRDSEPTTLTINVDRPALEVGLPTTVQRFDQGAAAALAHLVAQQSEDGGIATGDDPTKQLVVDSLAGLALIASGAGDPRSSRHQALTTLTAHVQESALTASSDASAFALAWATCLLAEQIGPLPAEIIVAASTPSISLGGIAGIDGAPPVMSGESISIGDIQFESAGGEAQSGGGGGGQGQMRQISAEQLEEMLGSTGGSGEVRMMTMGADGQLVESAPPNTSVNEAGGISAEAPTFGPTLDERLVEAEPSRLPKLLQLGLLVDAIIAGQGEDGGWAHGADDSTRIMTTTSALLAMGAAQRVGLELDGESVTNAVRFLRPLLHEGRLAGAVARGADRRLEAARAAQAACSLIALDCPSQDDLLAELLSFSQMRGRDVIESPQGGALALLATAIARRGDGINAWLTFYDAFRYDLVAAQNPDGSFEFPRGDSQSTLDQQFDDTTFDTALGALLLCLQHQRVPVLLSNAENPFAPITDGNGTRIARTGPAAPTLALPDGMQIPPGGVITIDDPSQIQDILKNLGIEGEIQGGGRATGGGDGGDG